MAARKYHLNPISGDPKLCTAQEGNCPYGDSSKHYPTAKAAREGFEGESKEKLFKEMKFNAWEKRMLRGYALVDHLKKLGFAASLGREFHGDFYHSFKTEEREPKLENLYPIHDESDPNSIYYEIVNRPDKPSGGLWLSMGVKNDDGKVITDWDYFWADDGQTAGYTKHTQKIHLRPEALILSLDEDTYRNVPKIFNSNAEPVPLRDEKRFFDDKWGTPWKKLQEFGVDGVYVDGRNERGHFSGWDVESLVILSGNKAIESFEPVEKEPVLEKILEFYRY